MTKPELFNRFRYLSQILEYSKDAGYFSVYQRMCINQERGAILAAVSQLEEDPNQEVKLRYKLPHHLERTATRVAKDFKIY